jgi:hypothetical protein
MTTLYSISQCEREIEDYEQSIANEMRTDWREFKQRQLAKWKARLEKAQYHHRHACATWYMQMVGYFTMEQLWHIRHNGIHTSNRGFCVAVDRALAKGTPS